MNKTLKYISPAKSFTEALPLGNGSLGAMVYGGVPEEKITLNYDTFWSGTGHGEYLRSAEMAEEQNYNMIDGRINNLLPKKENPEVPKKRKSVLLRLYKHRCEVAKKQGKPMPRRYQGMEMERNRK